VNDPITPCCGNGVTESGEECDDANTSNTDACLNTCQAARCGDGVVQTGVEQCDLGAGNADSPNAACRTDCRLPRCGDGVADDLRGEQCDDGNTTPNDGCSTTCSFELPLTAELIGGRGSAATDCALEWAMDRPTHDRNGRPDAKQTCRDGDPACDLGTAPGECVFHVWLCANNHDPLFPLCTPGAGGVGTVASVEVRKPSSKDVTRRPEDAQNRSKMSPAATAAQFAGSDACGPRMDLRVPRKDATRKGSKKFKLRATTVAGVVDSDSLKLTCVP
jgi:cysteine-rich repeat protein